MNILTILGSPRKKGNTAAVLSRFERIAAESGHRVERVNVVDYEIHGCLGCSRCQKVMDAPGCHQKDDAPAILERVLASDLIIYASPLYCWSFTAQLKALFDRHFCLMKWEADPYFSLAAGRRAALLVTCGDAAENNADFVQVMFDRQMECLRCGVAGRYIVDCCSTPRALAPRAEQVARQMADELLP
jgi:multimeric flavodoxin WrbA